MSMIKRYLEELSITITDAISECGDPYDHVEEYDIEEETMTALVNGDYDDIFDYLANRYFGDMPLTLKALKALAPHVSADMLLDHCFEIQADSLPVGQA